MRTSYWLHHSMMQYIDVSLHCAADAAATVPATTHTSHVRCCGCYQSQRRSCLRHPCWSSSFIIHTQLQSKRIKTLTLLTRQVVMHGLSICVYVPCASALDHPQQLMPRLSDLRLVPEVGLQCVWCRAVPAGRHRQLMRVHSLIHRDS